MWRGQCNERVVQINNSDRKRSENSMLIKTILQEAISTGELLTIIYNGGSQPGSTRMISPIKIIEDNKIRARCYTSNKVKTFIIEKIEITENNSGNTSYIEGKKPVEPKTIREAFKPHVSKLETLGWYVKFEENYIGLYRYFKNGKLRKTSDVSCIYSEFITDYIDVDADEELKYHEEKSARPYYVKSFEHDGRSYKYLSKAVTLFLEYAKSGANTFFFND